MTNISPSPVTSTVPFDQNGVFHGHLTLPHSDNQSAWGAIMIPITIAQNGDGPTLLLTGGNHGDEYEGPIALYDLAASINSDTLCGRVIIVPAMNMPAFRMATRLSPLDGANMNRIFPGKATGSVTEKIADYFQRHLLPMADYVLDIHSGGKTLDFVPFAAVHELDDKDLQHRAEKAMAAFNAPWSVQLRELDAAGMYDTAAENMGKVFLSTELGGGGSASATTVSIARKGIENLLHHTGIRPGGTTPTPATTMLTMPSPDCYITSMHGGLLEFCINIGEPVRAGQVIAKIHDINHSGQQATEYCARQSGILLGRHFPGLIRFGDILAVIAVES